MVIFANLLCEMDDDRPVKSGLSPQKTSIEDRSRCELTTRDAGRRRADLASLAQKEHTNG